MKYFNSIQAALAFSALPHLIEKTASLATRGEEVGWICVLTIGLSVLWVGLFMWFINAAYTVFDDNKR